MKKKIIGLFVLVYVACCLAGCGSIQSALTKPNPAYNPANPPDAATNAAFVENPNIKKVLDTANGVAQVTAPYNPYAPIVSGVLGLATLGMGYFVKRANGQASDANAALDTLARATAESGATSAVLNHPSVAESSYFGTISSALNNNIASRTIPASPNVVPIKPA